MRTAALVVALTVGLAGSASAELVAPRVQDGMLALSPSGRPAVAYVRGTALEIATRNAKGRWATTRVAAVSAGSKLVAFATGAAGPVALVQSADDRRLALVRRAAPGWRTTVLARRLPAGATVGWPGLALDRKGLAAVAYTRWQHANHNSTLELVRLDARGRARTQAVTREGFPKSFVAPPAAPVFAGRSLHVIESYGFDGAVGTIEWRPRGKSWGGQFLDGGVGDFPVGPLLAAVAPSGTLYTAWTEAVLGTGEFPVSLASRSRSIDSRVLLDRALTTSLIAPASGVAVGANEWVGSDELDLPGSALDWAGIVATRSRRVELDGWLAGLESERSGARDVLLARPSGLGWFRLPARPTVRVTIGATERADGSVLVSGRVQGVGSGRVSIYRERPGAVRFSAGTAPIARDGSFSLVDRTPRRPLLYRAVYTDPRSGVPYAALLRTPVT